MRKCPECKTPGHTARCKTGKIYRLRAMLARYAKHVEACSSDEMDYLGSKSESLFLEPEDQKRIRNIVKYYWHPRRES